MFANITTAVNCALRVSVDLTTLLTIFQENMCAVQGSNVMALADSKSSGLCLNHKFTHLHTYIHFKYTYAFSINEALTCIVTTNLVQFVLLHPYLQHLCMAS